MFKTAPYTTNVWTSSSVCFHLHRCDTESLSLVLRMHKDEVVQCSPQPFQSVYRLKIRRKRVFEDGLREFKRGFPLDKPFAITFIGEPAVDAGGPLREFFHILLADIANNNNLFEGSEGRVPRPNVFELEKKTYLYVGQMIATSLLHGGPAPSFFSKAVADYLVFGVTNVSPSTNDIPDASVRDSIQKVRCGCTRPMVILHVHRSSNLSHRPP